MRLREQSTPTRAEASTTAPAAAADATTVPVAAAVAAAEVTAVRLKGSHFLLIYDDGRDSASVSLQTLVDGVGTRFEVVGSAALVCEQTLEETRVERRRAKREAVRLEHAAHARRQQLAEANQRSLEDAKCAAFGLTREQAEELRTLFTKPAAQTIEGHLVVPVPDQRAVVIKTTLLDAIRSPLEESCKNLRDATAAKAARTTKRRVGVPNTVLGADLLTTAAYLRSTHEQDSKNVCARVILGKHTQQ